MSKLMTSKEFFKIVQPILGLPNNTRDFKITCRADNRVEVNCDFYAEKKDETKHFFKSGDTIRHNHSGKEMIVSEIHEDHIIVDHLEHGELKLPMDCVYNYYTKIYVY